ncbi:MAG: hypothetical protein ACK2UO_07155 [Caldilineaceae bacterium]
MNDDRLSAVFWAGGLVVTGILLLLLNFGLLERFEPVAQYVVAGSFAAAGVGFFGGYISNRSMWWRLIPGWTLLSVAVMVLLTTLSGVGPLFIPIVLFVGLALAFTNIYLINRHTNWWAVIPGGFLFVVSIIIGLYMVTDNLQMLFAFLLIGIGLVFLLLIVLGPTDVRWWPIIPGLVLVLFGLYILSGGSTAESALLRWWPILLIVIGLGMGWQSIGSRTGPQKLEVNAAPGTADRNRRIATPPPTPRKEQSGVLGEYSEPAPGASVEVLSQSDDD